MAVLPTMVGSEADTKKAFSKHLLDKYLLGSGPVMDMHGILRELTTHSLGTRRAAGLHLKTSSFFVIGGNRPEKYHHLSKITTGWLRTEQACSL